MKKVILIAAANDFARNLNTADFTPLLAPPLGILAVGSYLAAHAVPVEIIDVPMDFGFGFTPETEALVAQQVAQYVQKQVDQVAWVGISQLSNSGNGLILAEVIHTCSPDLPLILGGYFSSTVYQTLLEKYPFITAIARGDGEVAALSISQCLDTGQPFLSEQMPNLAWREEGVIRVNTIQPMTVEDLPLLDFRLLHHPDAYQIIDLMTSRGCPFHCNYCLESSMRPYAPHSLDWVARQLDYLESVRPQARVFIYDPIFGLGRERMDKMICLLHEHSFSYAVESRVDILTPAQVSRLHEAKVETIFLGIESASPATLLRMNKVASAEKALDYCQQALAVLEACFEANVTPVSGFMLGFPGDEESDYQATLEFTKKVGELHDRVTATTGQPTGFVPFAFYSKIYAGSSLAEQLQTHPFPGLVLRAEPFLGEHMVLEPTSGVTLEVTRRYQAAVADTGRYTTYARERLEKYFSFSMRAFCDEHPELTNADGITHLGDSLRRYAPEFRVESTRMRFEKSRQTAHL